MKNPTGHIVFLTPGFAESDSDTTTIPALQDYILAVSETTVLKKMTIITFQFPFQNKTYQWNGIQVTALNGANRKWKKPIVWNNAIKTLKKLHREYPITCIHSFWIGECSFVGQLFAKKYGIKHIITAMGQDVFNNKFARFLNPKWSQVVTLSGAHHNLLQKNYIIESTIIPWSIDSVKFPDFGKNTIDILGVGSLTELKNFSAFISIIKTVASKIPNLKVEIIGEGNQFHSLEKQISESNLTEIIKLTGKLSRSLVYQKMSQSKILLHTSRYESFGYVFAEALYSGMKIVSYPVGVSTDTEQWKTATNESEIVAALITFLEDTFPKKRIELTTKEEMLNAYFKLYNE